MSERAGYPPGVPCWVETLQPDPQAALTFYGALFGWTFAGPGPMPGDPPGQYFVAQHRGCDVAGIGSFPAHNAPSVPVWMTYIRVERADDAVARVVRAGGSVLVEPFDVAPAGRMAVCADPLGVSFCLWEARARDGAQRVNEPCAWAISTLLTSDLERSATFYGAVFGWQTEAFGDATLWRLPGYVGGEPEQPVPRDVVGVMMRVPVERPIPPHWHTEFWVADTDAAVATAQRLGGRVLVPPQRVFVFKRAVLADPAGAVFTVSQLIAPRASSVRVLVFVICFLVLGAARALAGPPFVTDDPEPTDYRHWEIYTGILYDNDGLGTTSASAPFAEFNYGAMPNVQVSFSTQLSDERAPGSGRYGFGPTEFGIKTRFVQESAGSPQISFYPSVVIPDVPGAQPVVFLPLWMQKSSGPWTAFGGGGVYLNPTPGMRDSTFVGAALERTLSSGTTVGAELFHQSSDTIGGSDLTAAGIGTIVPIGHLHAILFSVNRALHGADAVSAYASYEFALGPEK